MSSREQIINKNTKSDIFFTEGKTANENYENSRKNNSQSDILYQKCKSVSIDNPSYKTKLARSNIHFGDDKHESFVVKKDKISNKDYNPTPYFAEETAFQRRLKEFYPDSEKYKDFLSKTASESFTKAENFEEENRKREFANPEITAKERKYLQNCTNFSKVEIQSADDNINNDQPTSSENIVYQFISKDPKNQKINFLKSNIFHDEEKQAANTKITVNKIDEEEIVVPQPKVKMTVPFNPWKANIDWKDPKNELLFKNDYETSEDSSPLKRKVQDIYGKIDSSIKVNSDFVPITADLNEEKVAEDKQAIQSTFKELYWDNNKLRKNMELSSVSQRDFYSNSFKNVNTMNRPVSSYEVINIKDFENLKLKEFESLFSKKGIHIYDVKSTGAFTNGNTNGSLEFKIREKNNDKDFTTNLEEVKGTLKNVMGLEVKPKAITSKSKKLSDVLPTNIKWTNTQVHNYIKQRKEELSNRDYNTTFNPDVEKISKGVTINTAYKNNKGVNKFQKK